MQEIILRSDGTPVLRTVTEQPCSIVNDLCDQFSATAVRAVKNVFIDGGRGVGLVASNNETYMGCKLNALTLALNWEVDGESLVPRPIANGQKATGAVMKMEWVPHNGITLMFMAKIEATLSIADRKCFLLAFDSAKRNFQLPLPNIYDDCSVCMGEYNSRGQSYLECFQKALAQFGNSNWNTDLSTGDKQKKLEQLIRFKITKGEKADTFELEGNGKLWWNNCVSNRETRVTDAARGLL